MHRVQLFLLISHVIPSIFTQSMNSHSSGDNNLLHRLPDDVIVSHTPSANGARIAASFFIIHCQLLPNAHFIIQINEGFDQTMDAIPHEFLVNGIETSDELFEIITFKTPKARQTSKNASHVFCDGNGKHCRYYDFSRNWFMKCNYFRKELNKLIFDRQSSVDW